MCHNDLVLGSRSQKRSKQSRLEAKETRQTAPFKRRESRSLLAPLRRTAPVRPSPLSYHGSQRVSLKVLIQPGYTLITRDLGYLTIKKAISRYASRKALDILSISTPTSLRGLCPLSAHIEMTSHHVHRKAPSVVSLRVVLLLILLLVFLLIFLADEHLLVLFAHLLIVRALLPVLLTSLFILKTLALSILDALVLVLHALLNLLVLCSILRTFVFVLLILDAVLLLLTHLIHRHFLLVPATIPVFFLTLNNILSSHSLHCRGFFSGVR
jgi:hypothetical protein